MSEVDLASVQYLNIAKKWVIYKIDPFVPALLISASLAEPIKIAEASIVIWKKAAG